MDGPILPPGYTCRKGGDCWTLCGGIGRYKTPALVLPSKMMVLAWTDYLLTTPHMPTYAEVHEDLATARIAYAYAMTLLCELYADATGVLTKRNRGVRPAARFLGIGERTLRTWTKNDARVNVHTANALRAEVVRLIEDADDAN